MSTEAYHRLYTLIQSRSLGRSKRELAEDILDVFVALSEADIRAFTNRSSSGLPRRVKAPTKEPAESGKVLKTQPSPFPRTKPAGDHDEPELNEPDFSGWVAGAKRPLFVSGG